MRNNISDKQIMFIKFVIGVTLGILLIFILVRIANREQTGTIQNLYWQSEVRIEEYRTVQEDDWYLPSGGRLRYTRREIRSYEKVIDHYDDVRKSREVPYEVEEIYYTENSDGIAEKHTETKTKYKTEYYYEEEPVYREKPVYDTRYYYDIDKWMYSRSVNASDKTLDIYYGEVVLASNERESSHNVVYYVVIMLYIM